MFVLWCVVGHCLFIFVVQVVMSRLSAMNIDVLITLVFDKPPLWDRTHKLHGNRNVIDKYWKEISAEMKEDENKLRKKWKYLRDQFAVEFGKIPRDEAYSYEPKWPYYKPLLFLKDVVTPRASTGNLTKRSESLGMEDHSNAMHAVDDDSPSQYLQDKASQNEQNDGEEDEHIYFFKSLLPHVRKIPQHKLLSFRSRIQEVVEEFAYPQPYRSPLPFTSTPAFDKYEFVEEGD